MKNLADAPFALIGVHGLDHSPEKLKEVMAEEGLNWRSFANGRAISTKWSARSTPAYYVIDHRGIIRHKWMGYPGKEVIDSALQGVIATVEESAE